jgi:hypothetical protein
LSVECGCCECGEKEEWGEFHGGPQMDCGCWLTAVPSSKPLAVSCGGS